ncbi:g7195 [Coccomyxa elongata]
MLPPPKVFGDIPDFLAGLERRPLQRGQVESHNSSGRRPFIYHQTLRRHCFRIQRTHALDTPVEATTRVQNVDNDAKRNLLAALSSVQDNGMYGLEVHQREEILKRIKELEACNPLEAPTEHLDQCQGSWHLLFSTVTILGRRRIKLGLKNIVNIGELTQHIDTVSRHTVNVVNFDILVFGKFKGSLTIEASYEPVSPHRVAIKLEKATLLPAQFQQLFQKNYDMLMDIFNPEGWLDITFVDAQLRVGRDDKGNVFVLEREQS